MMKRVLLNTLMVSLLATSSVAFSQATENAESYLFIQVAPSATLSENKDNPGSYQLTLNHVNPSVEYFADRPVRSAGKITLSDFLTKWHSDFDKVPPNVGVVGLKSLNDLTTNLVLELSNPKYIKDKQTLTYDATFVSEKTGMPQTLTLNNVALFIDNYCASCASQGF